MGIPKLIHLFWHESIDPTDTTCTTTALERVFLTSCVQRIRKVHPEYTVTLYTLEDIYKCYNFPKDAFATYIGTNKYAHISDWFRLYIIYHKGGVWLDISSIVFKSIDRLYDTTSNTLQMFHTAWSYSNIACTWFIACSPKNTFVQYWLEEYTSAIYKTLPVYCNENTGFIPDGVYIPLPYLTFNLCFCKVYQILQNSSLHVTLLPSVDKVGYPMHNYYAYLYGKHPNQKPPHHRWILECIHGYCINPPSAQRITIRNADEVFRTMFKLMIKHKCNLGGFYPTNYPLSMVRQPHITTDLRFIHDPITLMRNQKLLLNEQFANKMDFERTIQYYKQDRRVFRFNHYTFCTAYNPKTSTGGFGYRNPQDERRASEAFQKEYAPYISRMITHKNGSTSFVLVKAPRLGGLSEQQ